MTARPGASVGTCRHCDEPIVKDGDTWKHVGGRVVCSSGPGANRRVAQP